MSIGRLPQSTNRRSEFFSHSHESCAKKCQCKRSFEHLSPVMLAFLSYTQRNEFWFNVKLNGKLLAQSYFFNIPDFHTALKIIIYNNLFPFAFHQSVISFPQTIAISTIYIFVNNLHLLFNNHR